MGLLLFQMPSFTMPGYVRISQSMQTKAEWADSETQLGICIVSSRWRVALQLLNIIVEATDCDPTLYHFSIKERGSKNATLETTHLGPS